MWVVCPNDLAPPHWTGQSRIRAVVEGGAKSPRDGRVLPGIGQPLRLTQDVPEKNNMPSSKAAIELGHNTLVLYLSLD